MSPPNHHQCPPGPVSTESLIVQLASYVDRLDWASVFDSFAPGNLELELGCGDGGFMLEWARQNPAARFFAVERLLGRLRKLDKRGRRAGLSNLKLLRLEGGYFLKYLVPAGSVRFLHVYFPDPWPKRRHWKNRLVNEAFAESTHKALEAGGVIYLRTDNLEYYEQMSEVFGANQEFEKARTPEPLMAVRTDFEREFNERGIQTLYAAYRKAVGGGRRTEGGGRRAEDGGRRAEDGGRRTEDGGRSWEREW